MKIVDPILFHARTSPSAIAICTPGTRPESITYGELERLMNNIGRMAVLSDLSRGQIVAIYVKDKMFEIGLMLALMRQGIATLTPRSPSLPKELGVHAVITDAPSRFENVGRVILADASWRKLHDTPLADERLYQVADDDLCRIVLTSGTTGDAKSIAFSQKKLIERIPRFEFVMGNRLSLSRRLFCDLGIQTGIGLQVILYMLWKGGTVFLFGADSASMVQGFELFKVQGMMTSPHGLAQYLAFYELPGAPSCGLEFVVCLGAQLPRSMSERARAHLSPNLYSAYGSTEVSTSAGAPAHLVADIAGAVGYPTPDVSIEIVDETGRPLAAGREGLVRIRSPQSVTSYRGDSEASARAFRDGWFYPGDIGTLTAKGMLVIRGRDSSVINLGGDKVNPELIEEILTTFGGVSEAGVFALPDAREIPVLWAAVVSPSVVDWAKLQGICASKLGAAYVPARFVRVPALPKNQVGKLDRARLPQVATAPS
jgi:acyl-coenzyme A synthetase/AMP-(fatty) acid ligase